MTESNQCRREIVAHNIAVARETAELSKRRLARLADVDERQLRIWESARHTPSAYNLLKLAAILGQSLEWFYEDHDDESPDSG